MVRSIAVRDFVMSACAFAAVSFERSSWFQLWLPIGKPAAAIRCHVSGGRRTARPTGKNVAGACLAWRIAKICWVCSRLQPSSKVRATRFAVGAPWRHTANPSAAVPGDGAPAPGVEDGVAAGEPMTSGEATESGEPAGVSEAAGAGEPDDAVVPGDSEGAGAWVGVDAA